MPAWDRSSLNNSVLSCWTRRSFLILVPHSSHNTYAGKILFQKFNTYDPKISSSIFTRPYFKLAIQLLQSLFVGATLEQLLCTNCDHVFKSKTRRSAHHRQVRPYPADKRRCFVCDLYAKTTQELAAHISKSHQGPLISQFFPCGQCNKSLRFQEDLTCHQIIKHGRIYPSQVEKQP